VENLHNRIIALAASINVDVLEIDALPASGGDRLYLRVHCKKQNLIATYSDNLVENKTFFEWTKTIEKLNLPVPKLLAIAPERDLYLQQDLGTECLLDYLLHNNYNDVSKAYYKTVLQNLVQLQLKADTVIDYSLCLVRHRFNAEAALFDLNYFVQYYLSTTKIEYNASLLAQEFTQLSLQVDAIQPQGFMYRDLQGRNIMLHNNEPYFIDFQGGMQGPLQYDVASLLWQAKANLPNTWRQELLEFYIQELQKNIEVDEVTFKANYQKIVLMRLLQVLGAYGRRGILEGKQHFIDSIPQGIANVKQFSQDIVLDKTMPELSKIITSL
jgi:aminoglycoside/choline kinase family phosphotransferase